MNLLMKAALQPVPRLVTFLSGQMCTPPPKKKQFSGSAPVLVSILLQVYVITDVEHSFTVLYLVGVES